MRRRWLFHHPESSCYMEVFDLDEAIALNGADCGNVVDVTGIKHHEQEWSRMAGRKKEM